MKIKTFYLILLLTLTSCAYKPLYKKSNNFYPNKIKIIVKSEENYENNVSMMKAYLNNYVLCNLIPYKERNFSKIIPKVVYVVKQNKKNKNKSKKNILTLKF